MNIKTIVLIILFVIAVIILSCDEKTLEGFYGGYYGYPYYRNHYSYPYYTGYHLPWYRRYFYPSFWFDSPSFVNPII